MTDTESLNGTYEIHEDGSVSTVGLYSGTLSSESAEELRELGFETIEQVASHLEANGYKRRAPAPETCHYVQPAEAITFPSGSTLTLCGGYITGRIEPQPEPVRAPLPHFNQRTEFDPFKGFYNHPDARIRSSYVGFVTIEPEPNPDALPANVNLLRG